MSYAIWIHLELRTCGHLIVAFALAVFTRPSRFRDTHVDGLKSTLPKPRLPFRSET